DIGKRGQIPDLGQGLIAVGEFQQVPVRIRNHDVVGLAAYPAAHINISVGGTGPIRVYVQADSGLALLAVAAAAAGDVERHAADVAYLDEFDISAGFDDLAGYLVTEYKVLGRRRAPADHMLIATAD